MGIITYDSIDDFIKLLVAKWSNLKTPNFTRVWDKRTVGFIDDRRDEVVISPKGENIEYFGLGGAGFWHEQIIELDIRTYQNIDRHNDVVKEIVDIVKKNIVNSDFNYTDLRIIGAFSRNYKFRNYFNYVITISYRQSLPAPA